jgi:hypothetical protein
MPRRAPSLLLARAAGPIPGFSLDLSYQQDWTGTGTGGQASRTASRRPTQLLSACLLLAVCSAAVFSCRSFNFEHTLSVPKNNTQPRPTAPRDIVRFSCLGPSPPLSPTRQSRSRVRSPPFNPSAIASFEPRWAPEPESRVRLRGTVFRLCAPLSVAHCLLLPSLPSKPAPAASDKTQDVPARAVLGGVSPRLTLLALSAGGE